LGVNYIDTGEPPLQKDLEVGTILETNTSGCGQPATGRVTFAEQQVEVGYSIFLGLERQGILYF
jgi:hypothetical protein